MNRRPCVEIGRSREFIAAHLLTRVVGLSPRQHEHEQGDRSTSSTLTIA